MQAQSELNTVFPDEKMARMISDKDEVGSGMIRRGEIWRFFKTEYRMLIAPAGTIERGHNIVDDEGHSVLTSVFFLTRPMNAPGDIEESMARVNGIGKATEYNLKSSSLERLFISWLPGVVMCSAISKIKDNAKWLVSCEEVDHKSLAGLVRVWILGEYIENERRKGKIPKVRELASAFYEKIEATDLVCQGPIELKLFNDDLTAACNESFRVFSLLVARQLAGQHLDIDGQKIPLLLAGKNSLMTAPHVLFSKRTNHLYSIGLEFSLQTVPPARKAMLIYHVRIKRWVSKSELQKAYEGKATTAYIHTGENRIQPIKFKYVNGTLVWDPSDKRCYESFRLENTLPDLGELVRSPKSYISDQPGSTVITFRNALNLTKKHAVKPGMPMIDRIAIYEWLVQSLSEFVVAAPAAARVRKRITGIDPLERLSKSKFRDRMAQAIGGRKLTIEVYSSDKDKIGNMVLKKAKENFGLVPDQTVLDSPELVLTVVHRYLGPLSDVLNPGLKLKRECPKLWSFAERLKKNR